MHYRPMHYYPTHYHPTHYHPITLRSLTQCFVGKTVNHSRTEMHHRFFGGGVLRQPRYCDASFGGEVSEFIQRRHHDCGRRQLSSWDSAAAMTSPRSLLSRVPSLLSPLCYVGYWPIYALRDVRY
eukprot:2227641-Rhodomonas_salina.2